MNAHQWQDITWRDMKWTLDPPAAPILPDAANLELLIERICDLQISDPELLIAQIVGLTFERDGFAMLAKASLAEASDLRRRAKGLQEQLRMERQRVVPVPGRDGRAA